MYPITFLSTENFDSRLWIQKTQARKVRVIHGTADDVIPIEESKRLFSKTGVVDKEFVAVPLAHHDDIYDFDETVRSIRASLVE